MKIAILGFGREGRAVYQYLNQQHEVWILDSNPSITVPPEAKKRLGNNYLDGLDEFDIIYRSPGVPYQKVRSLVSSPNKLTSATKLFFQKYQGLIIGITGTKGKGTTATLLYNILKLSGKDVFLAGNIGRPALDILPYAGRRSIAVLELSSFQLEDLKQSPPLSIVLDIFPDHLDVYPSFTDYWQAKEGIVKYQTAQDVVFYFSDNQYSKQIACQSPGIKVPISGPANLPINVPGKHNQRNAQAAFLAARYLNCPENKIMQAFTNFKGNEHRLERIPRLGLEFVNDSASTSPQTTLAAVRSFSVPKILIAGGSDKNLDYSLWAQEFPKLNLKSIILIGENKYKIKKALSGDFQSKLCKISLKDSLKDAVWEAKCTADKGDVILFSPGSASFDMFENYADRGQKFKILVNSL